MLCEFIREISGPSTHGTRRGLQFTRIRAVRDETRWTSHESRAYDLAHDRYPARDYLEKSSVFFSLGGRFDPDPNPTLDILLSNRSASPQVLLSYGIEVTAARYRVISGGSVQTLTLKNTEHYKIEFPYPRFLTGANAHDNTTKTVAVAPENYRGSGAFASGAADSPDAVYFWEWAWASTPVVSRSLIDDPRRLEPGASYRFSLEIEHAERMPTDTLLRVLIKTDNAEFKSDAIYFLKP